MESDNKLFKEDIEKLKQNVNIYLIIYITLAYLLFYKCIFYFILLFICLIKLLQENERMKSDNKATREGISQLNKKVSIYLFIYYN